MGDLPPDRVTPGGPSVYECGDRLFRPHCRQKGPGSREEVETGPALGGRILAPVDQRIPAVFETAN